MIAAAIAFFLGLFVGSGFMLLRVIRDEELAGDLLLRARRRGDEKWRRRQ